MLFIPKHWMNKNNEITVSPFCEFETQEQFIKHHLNIQLSAFKRGWLSESGWRFVVSDNDEDNMFTNSSIFEIRNKCKYLTKAIENALERYQNSTWKQCCISAIDEINKFEKCKNEKFEYSDNFNQRWIIKSPKTIMKWYHQYNHIHDQSFPNPFVGKMKNSLPPLLDKNPDIVSAIISYSNNNLLKLSSEMLQEYIIETCLPQLLEKRKEELNDNTLTLEFIKKENNLKIISCRTVNRWMKLLGYRYCERKKSYYCDSHEKPENVAYRYKYINRYLEREFRCYRWIQLSEEKYQQMLDEGTVFNGIPYEYNNEAGQKFYEFHVDDNLNFSTWRSWPDEDSKRFGGCLSVRMPIGTKPIIIFGQDECIFKQYIFSKKSWMGPEGQTPMIPKDEGCGVMFSSFVSREYGFNLQLSAEQLATVNQNRKGQFYKDREAAELKRGNAKKEDLTCSPFSRKLDYGINKEGYWTYEEMVMQFEDCVDVLKAINGDKYDYCFLFDHSNGHDRLRPDGLSLSKISKYYGGKQPLMRSTTIEHVSYLGPYNHDKKLKVGDIQSMVYNEHDVGPYYFNNATKISKKFDKTDGSTREVELTKEELMENLKAVGITAKGKKEDLVKVCTNNNLPLKRTETIVDEGWCDKAKGSLQILWERGWIDPSKSHKYYTKEGKKDLYGLVDESTSIDCLMAKQPDFLEQETLLQYYGKLLGVETDRSPKCHPEIAGEGIEFNWGCSKVYYRSQPIARKRCKDNFYELVDESLGSMVLNIGLCRNNARRARLYMLAYKALEDVYDTKVEEKEEKKHLKTNARYNHTLIERCVSLFRKRRSHRSALDFDTKYLKDETMKNLIVKMCARNNVSVDE